MLKILLLCALCFAEIGTISLIVYGKKNGTFTSKGGTMLSIYVTVIFGCAALAIALAL